MCNVQLADAIFHESTINALIVYSKEYPEFLDTAEYLKRVRKWWNIVNVNSESLGKAKRDENRNAVSVEDSRVSDYLRSFADWFETWHICGEKSSSLTNETFTTSIQTTRALPQLAEYLLTERSFKFVLYRHINSDCIEGRFRKDRMLNGANYYATVRNFIDAEKTIRLKCLVRFNKLNMADIKGMFTEISGAAELQIDTDVSTIIARINVQLRLENISCDQNGILFYVSGYFARSIKKSTKCTSCWELIVKDDTIPTVNVDDIVNKDDYKCFFNTINRGGLCNPSNILHMVTTHAYEFFSTIFRNEEWKSMILSFNKPRTVFVKSFTEKLKDDATLASLSAATCQSHHSFTKIAEAVAFKMFNVCSKNYASNFSES